MDTEYGGERSFSRYMWKKEEMIPLSYNKKYLAEIESGHEKYQNDSLLFANCNFYIDDFVSLFSLYNSDNVSNIDRTILHPSEQSKMKNVNGNYYFMNETNGKTVDRYADITGASKSAIPCNCDRENGVYPRLQSGEVDVADTADMPDVLDRTPIKSTYFGDREFSRSYAFDSFMKTYESAYSCKRSVQATYINKKEQLEILIVQNGGIIHNALTSKVTHIISNNMALGSKKYMDYKKAFKKSKVFIVVDKYIFDCVSLRSRLPEQSYLPSLLRYNSRQITEFFSFKKRSIQSRGIKDQRNADAPSEEEKRENNNPSINYISERGRDELSEHCTLRDIQTDVMSTDRSGIGTTLTGDMNIVKPSTQFENARKGYVQRNKHLQILNIQMSYENVKKYIIYNSWDYFKRLYKFYLDKEVKENIFPNVSPNLHINKNTFEEFLRKYRILNHLSEQEIRWIKQKSGININIKNVWENDIIHFFFDIVLKTRTTNREEGGEMGYSGTLSSAEESASSHRLIDSVRDYLHNSRLYILGNWNYITRVFFNFEDIKEKDKRKCVYFYIDFDNYFLNASVKCGNSFYCKNRNFNSEILCVCHSLKKEESYGIISATNYWGKKNKIFKGMIKGEVTKLHNNNKDIHFVKYNFSNILRCSYLFLLVLINYSNNVRVLSVDESIFQLFYEKEEDIFCIAKNISDDIYSLTNLPVSIGISASLNLSRKALKFCKKRFLFFDFYHHFSIFIRRKWRAQWGEAATMCGENGENSSSNSIDRCNRPDVECLFDEYVLFEEGRREQLESTGKTDEKITDEENSHFLNSMKDNIEEEVEHIFDEFIRMKKEKGNLENILDIFFENITHPVSKYFFFYKKNEHYLDILKKMNYFNGDFIYFNVYYISVNASVELSQSEGNKIESIINKKKKDLDKIEEKRSINISVNYGVRFQKINDFYFLIYFMTKQLYIRLKIKNMKAKSLSVNFFVREENENINPMKYLGRGKVIKVSNKIKLSHYTDCFFIFFFKIIYNFDNLAKNLTELRGVQLICSDIVNDDIRDYVSRKSILYYFHVGTEGENVKTREGYEIVGGKDQALSDLQSPGRNEPLGKRDQTLPDLPPPEEKPQKEEEEKKKNIHAGIPKKEEGSNDSPLNRTNEMISMGKKKLTPNVRNSNYKVNSIKEKRNEKSTNLTTVGRSKNGSSSVRVSSDPYEKSTHVYKHMGERSILSYFMNRRNGKGDTPEGNLISLSFERKIVKNVQERKVHFALKKTRNHVTTGTNIGSTSKFPKKIHITRNYKISDFFPNILVKRKRDSDNIHYDGMKKYMEKSMIMQENIFDSIINKRIKKEQNIKEEINCCYLCYKEIRENVFEKQKVMHNNMYYNCEEECANNIFCYTYVSNCLYRINQKNETFNLYIFIKKITYSYISYFNNAFDKHDCSNKSTDEYYLHKFVATIIDNLCDNMHSKRLIDILHKFLKIFKYVWCLNGLSFPPLLENAFTKYNVHQPGP
ncbi:DNA repair protein REV1, putative [Plasmodium ovale]|uniref:DNA repair protein REV1, putative n=1 Tax=Plasmodium ovale TaxID=36330 RepID=A0A1D3U7K9_PLAOA|nr:DNA repair protein REV1, putative [Plasmodium ovale]